MANFSHVWKRLVVLVGFVRGPAVRGRVTAGPHPVAGLVILALAFAVPAARRWGRTLVTIVHEAGHAAVGIACGRRFQGFVVRQDMSGHAITSGRPTGPGRVLTSWAGYPAPAVFGALLVAGALNSWSGPILGAVTLMLAILLVMSRSLLTAGVVLVTGLACYAAWWWGGPYRAGVVAGIGLLLLLGAWESLRDVAAVTTRAGSWNAGAAHARACGHVAGELGPRRCPHDPLGRAHGDRRSGVRIPQRTDGREPTWRPSPCRAWCAEGKASRRV